MKRKDSPTHPNARVSHAENRFDAARINLDGETFEDIRAAVIAARTALTVYDTTPNDRPFSRPEEIQNLGIFRDRVAIAEEYLRIREYNAAQPSHDQHFRNTRFDVIIYLIHTVSLVPSSRYCDTTPRRTHV